MASPLDEMTKLLAGLATGSNSKKTVESLKTVAASISPSELRDYVPKIDVDRLFACFATSDREQVEMTCDLLAHILGCFSSRELLLKYHDLFLEGLAHPQTLVKELILQQLQKIADDSDAAVSLSTNFELVTACLRLVGSDDISIASKAVRVLTSLTKGTEAGNVFVKPPIIKEMQEIGQKNDTVRYRIYEIVVALALTSEEKLSFAHDAKLIQMLIEEASKNDILIQLNALELLRNLVAVQHGRDYLERERVIEALMNQLSSSANDPLASLIVPGLMKFFGTLAHFQPEFLIKYPIFTDTLFQMLEDADLALVMVAMETISFTAATIQGKTVLYQLGSRMDGAVVRIGQLLTHASSDVRLKALHSLAELVHIPPHQNHLADAQKAVEYWFNLLSKNPVTVVLNILKQPFRDLRLAALNVFLQLSSQPWAQKLMNEQAGFLEFLLDRKAEPDKECLERKFEIVQSVVASPTSAGTFSDYAMAQMRDHVREGPWFVHAQSNVAFESER